MPAQNRALRVLKQIGIWGGTAFLFLVFAAAGVKKLLPESGWAQAFTQWGFPPWFRVLVGVLETAAATLVLVPRAAAYGALLIVIIMAGAIGTHLLHGETTSPAIAVEGVAILLAAIIYWARPRPSFLSRPSVHSGSN